MKKIALLLTASILSLSANAATSIDLKKDTKSWTFEPLSSISISQPEVTIKEIVIEPNETLPVHLHPVINAGVLLSGELTVYTEDKKKALHLKANTKNSSLIEMVGKYHYGVNESNEPAKIIVFYIAEKGQKVTELKPKS